MAYIEKGDVFRVEDDDGFREVTGRGNEPPEKIRIVTRTNSGLEVKETGGNRDGKILPWAERPIRQMMENDVIVPLN